MMPPSQGNLVEVEIEESDTSLVRLSEHNRSLLLRDACDAVLREQPTAKRILERLSQLNPPLAENFHLKEAAIFKFPFRLLCSSQSSHPVPSYLAISYCWRASSWQPVDEGTFSPWPISRPMVEAISKLKNSVHEGVWIDKPCIDQGNHDEKLLAIGSMDIVYRAARQLVIILEDVQLGEEEEAAATKYDELFQAMIASDKGALIFETFSQRFHPSDTEYTHVAKFISKILSARWYERAWCSHEINVRPRESSGVTVFLLFGSKKQVLQLEHRYIWILVTSLAYFSERRSLFNPYSTTTRSLAQRAAIGEPTPNLIRRSMLRSGNQEGSRSSILDDFITISVCGCSRLEDRISMTLNLGRISLFFTGRAETSDECYWIVTALALAAADISPLRLEGYKLKIRVGNALIPSWAQQPLLKEDYKILDLSSVTALTPEFIELDLLILQKTPKPPSDGSLETAKSLISRFQLDSYAHVPEPTDLGKSEQKHMLRHLENTVNSNESLRDHWLPDFLACSLGCGLDWIRNFASVFKQQLDNEEWIYGELGPPNVELEPAAAALISILKGPTDPSPDFISKVTQFLTCATDLRFRFVITVPRRICTGDGQHAITNLTWATFWLAVPVALAGTCFFKTKMWLLEPYDSSTSPDPRQIDESMLEPLPDASTYKGFIPSLGQSPATVVRSRTFENFDTHDIQSRPNREGFWRLMQKDKLLGCPPVQEHEGIVKLARKQRVFG